MSEDPLASSSHCCKVKSDSKIVPQIIVALASLTHLYTYSHTYISICQDIFSIQYGLKDVRPDCSQSFQAKSSCSSHPKAQLHYCTSHPTSCFEVCQSYCCSSPTTDSRCQDHRLRRNQGAGVWLVASTLFKAKHFLIENRAIRLALGKTSCEREPVLPTKP